MREEKKKRTQHRRGDGVADTGAQANREDMRCGGQEAGAGEGRRSEDGPS